MSKKEPTYDEAHYSIFISEDYGATFKETRICPYNWELTWKFENTGDLAYISKGKVAMAGANHGVYIISDKGATVTQLDTVKYAKCIGYGAPEKAGGPNTLFIYGQPTEKDPEGVYRSTDEGKTWVCINTAHLYGGTGNGNYLVGDMNEFGKVYMSTVGCGIVYGKIAGSSEKPPVTTSKTTATTTKTTVTTTVTTVSSSATKKDDKTTTSAPKNVLWGDANCNGDVDLSDAVLIMQYLSNPSKYGEKGSDKGHMTAQGKINADVAGKGDGVTNLDALAIQRYQLKLIDELPTD